MLKKIAIALFSTALFLLDGHAKHKNRRSEKLRNKAEKALNKMSSAQADAVETAGLAQNLRIVSK